MARYLESTSEPTPAQWLGTSQGFINPPTQANTRLKAMSRGAGDLARTLLGEQARREQLALSERRLALAEEKAAQRRKTAAEIEARRKDEKLASREFDERLELFTALDPNDYEGDPEELKRVAGEITTGMQEFYPRLSSKDAARVRERISALPMMRAREELRLQEKEESMRSRAESRQRESAFKNRSNKVRGVYAKMARSGALMRQLDQQLAQTDPMNQERIEELSYARAKAQAEYEGYYQTLDAEYSDEEYRDFMPTQVRTMIENNRAREDEHRRAVQADLERARGQYGTQIHSSLPVTERNYDIGRVKTEEGEKVLLVNRHTGEETLVDRTAYDGMKLRFTNLKKFNRLPMVELDG